jgi:PAS domain-containing protein
MAAEDLLLTPTVQPELQAYRRWLCGQVEDQSSGGQPSAWSAEDGLQPAARRALSWDSSAVTGSAQSLIAADDGNVVIAASRPALDLLGYDEQQLVGRRISLRSPCTCSWGGAH